MHELYSFVVSLDDREGPIPLSRAKSPWGADRLRQTQSPQVSPKFPERRSGFSGSHCRSQSLRIVAPAIPIGEFVNSNLLVDRLGEVLIGSTRSSPQGISSLNSDCPTVSHSLIVACGGATDERFTTKLVTVLLPK